ncbi:glmZ(sRNA)-inactivating NTPase [Salmonella enterica]|nr:glmZ(sRNA)-inactivating NTPase [Salmonella enterica]
MQTARVDVTGNQGIAVGIKKQQLRRESARQINLPGAFSPQLLFLDADRNTLIPRYIDTRRLHPLSSKNLSFESAIAKESDLLEPLRSRADLHVDPSE